MPQWWNGERWESAKKMHRKIEHHWKFDHDPSRKKNYTYFQWKKKTRNKQTLKSVMDREKKTCYWMDIIKKTTEKKVRLFTYYVVIVLNNVARIWVCLWSIVSIDDNHSIQLICPILYLHCMCSMLYSSHRTSGVTQPDIYVSLSFSVRI